MNFFSQFFLIFLLILTKSISSFSQKTFEEIDIIRVNENVTTVITSRDAIRFVDISTEKVAADQPIENTLRLKPKEASLLDGEPLAVVTIITESFRTQYALIYTSNIKEAISDKEISLEESTSYNNPSITMTKEDMYLYARRIWLSTPRFRGVSNKGRGLKMRLNNIYSIGEYFFIDFTIENKTNIRFSIDEIRLKLKDKKTHKGANSQIIELPISLILDGRKSFLHGYRNVIVVKKLTFPGDKVLLIEASEKQISGRTISITIDYEDVLSSDSFNKNLTLKAIK